MWSDRVITFMLHLLHADAVFNLCVLSVVVSCLAVDTSITKIAIHPINLCDVSRSALRADIHIKLFIPALLAVRQRQIYAFVESQFHRSANQRTEGTFVVRYRVSTILDFAAIEQIPEAIF